MSEAGGLLVCTGQGGSSSGFHLVSMDTAREVKILTPTGASPDTSPLEWVRAPYYCQVRVQVQFTLIVH